MNREQVPGSPQDAPHSEGNMGNMPPEGRAREESHAQSQDNMLRHSPEQLAGHSKQQDEDVQNAAGEP